MTQLEAFIAISVAILSTGSLWQAVGKMVERRDKNSVLLLGISQILITSELRKHLDKGYISQYEFDALHTHMIKPYVVMGGNGLVVRLWAQVEGLPIKNS